MEVSNQRGSEVKLSQNHTHTGRDKGTFSGISRVLFSMFLHLFVLLCFTSSSFVIPSSYSLFASEAAPPNPLIADQLQVYL